MTVLQIICEYIVNKAVKVANYSCCFIVEWAKGKCLYKVVEILGWRRLIETEEIKIKITM